MWDRNQIKLQHTSQNSLILTKLRMRRFPRINELPNQLSKRHGNKDTKPLANSSARPSTYLSNCHEVIFNTDLLPLTIDLFDSQSTYPTVLITPSTITAKHKSDQINLPWKIQSHKWVHLTLEQQVSRIEIKTEQNENKIDKARIYSSIKEWQKEEGNPSQSLFPYLLSPILKTLQRKHNRNTYTGRNKLKGNTIAFKLPNRASQRANSYSFKPKISSHRHHGSNISQWCDLKEEPDTLFWEPKIESEVLRDSHKQKDNSHSKLADRMHNRVGRQLRKNVDGKSKVFPSLFEEYVPSNFKARPKFCHQVPLSFEEVELKRGKFQSQFIHKHKTVSTHPFQSAETEVSEVQEQINRPDAEVSGFGFEDTFEQPKAFVLDAEESGTLYESKYE